MTLHRLGNRNLVQRAVALEGRLIETAALLAKTYRTELSYLEIDVSNWPEQGAWSLQLLPDAHDLALELQAALPAYSEVHPRASTHSQEEERAPLRAERAEAIARIVARWDDLISNVGEFDDDPQPEELEDEADNISKSDYDAIVEKSERLERKYAQARSAVATRTGQRDDARKQVEALRSVITKMEREGGQPVLPSGNTDSAAETHPEAGQEQVGSVFEAITAAEINFPGRLLVSLNAASREDTPFQRPHEVYAALEWLATEYSDIRLNPLGTDPEFERRLKETCPGWSYSPKQSDTAKNMFKGEYQTTVESRTYTLDQHIGKGTKGDPQYMIRIAFAWDNDLGKVIVGYIGPHQRTQAS